MEPARILEIVGIIATIGGLAAVSIAAWWLYPAFGLAVAGGSAVFAGVVSVLAANRRADA